MGIGSNGTRNLEMARKAKDTPHLRLRIEPSLLARLQKSADKNERTLTGEIVDRLDASFRREDTQALIDATANRIAEKVLLASEAERNKIIEDELFQMDFRVLSEMFPDTPKEKIEESLIKRREALQAKRK
jgi:hypothetical protein